MPGDFEHYSLPVPYSAKVNQPSLTTSPWLSRLRGNACSFWIQTCANLIYTSSSLGPALLASAMCSLEKQKRQHAYIRIALFPRFPCSQQGRRRLRPLSCWNPMSSTNCWRHLLVSMTSSSLTARQSFCSPMPESCQKNSVQPLPSFALVKRRVLCSRVSRLFLNSADLALLALF